MDRVIFFFDGFNVYHSIIIKRLRKYLWLDFYKLAKRFTRTEDELKKVYYFSAYEHKKPDSVKRHKILTSALMKNNVIPVMGKFKNKTTKCKLCHKIFSGREEKQTDVNIAIYMFNEAMHDNFDTAFICTADTDLLPAIGLIKTEFPDKKIGILFPLGRRTKDLKDAADFTRIIERKDLSKSQFPEEVTLDSGIVLKRPSNWV